MDFLLSFLFYAERDGTWDCDDSGDKGGDALRGVALISRKLKTGAGQVWLLVTLYEANSVTDTEKVSILLRLNLLFS